MHYAAKSILRNDLLAEEAVQEAFLRIARNFTKVGDVDSPMTKRFVVVITENAAKSTFKQEQKHRNAMAEDAPDFADVSMDTTISEVNSNEMIREVLGIPKAQRDTLYLYSIYGYSYKEVANLLGISEAAARKNVERARKTLRIQDE